MLLITHLVSEGDGMAGLSVQFNPYNAMRVSLQDSTIRDSAHKETFFPPLYLQGLDSDSRPAGNIHFRHVEIKDDLARPVLRISDRNGNGLKDITGDIVLERSGGKERITVDDAWLQEMPRIGSANTSRP